MTLGDVYRKVDFVFRRRHEKPRPENVAGQQLTRRRLLGGAVGAGFLAATAGCAASATPDVDENGFSTTRISLLTRRKRLAWKTYRNGTEMTNGHGYYVKGQQFISDRGAVLQGSIAPESAAVPPNVVVDKRLRGSVMYLDEPRKFGRWTIEARFPKGTLPFHAVIMLWPSSDSPGAWKEGEIDLIEAAYGYSMMQSFIHYNNGGSDEQRIDGPPVPFDEDWHTYTVEWSPNGVRLFMDGKLLKECGPDLVAPLAKRLTFQVDASDRGTDVSGYPNGSAPETVMEVCKAEYQEYLGIERTSAPTSSRSSLSLAG